MFVRKGPATAGMDNRGEAHLLKELSPSGGDPCPHSAGEQMQAQGRRFTCPKSHSKDTTRARTEAVPTPLFLLGVTGHLAQSWSSINIYCSNAESKTDTLIGLTASQTPSPTHVTSVLNKYLLDADERASLEKVFFMKAFLMIQLTHISFYPGFPVLMAVHLFIHSCIHSVAYSLQHSESTCSGPGTGYRD